MGAMSGKREKGDWEIEVVRAAIKEQRKEDTLTVLSGVVAGVLLVLVFTLVVNVIGWIFG